MSTIISEDEQSDMATWYWVMPVIQSQSEPKFERCQDVAQSWIEGIAGFQDLPFRGVPLDLSRPRFRADRHARPAPFCHQSRFGHLGVLVRLLPIRTEPGFGRSVSLGMYLSHIVCFTVQPLIDKGVGYNFVLHYHEQIGVCRFTDITDEVHTTRPKGEISLGLASLT
jgi:hypothetical protein